MFSCYDENFNKFECHTLVHENVTDGAALDFNYQNL